MCDSNFSKMVHQELLKNQIIKKTPDFNETINIKKNRIRDLKIDELIGYLEEVQKYLSKANVLHKELVNKTEYWEEENPSDFKWKVYNLSLIHI